MFKVDIDLVFVGRRYSLIKMNYRQLFSTHIRYVLMEREGRLLLAAG